MKRCWKCENCKNVDIVRKQALRILADPRNRMPQRTPIGEDVRIIWNDILANNPCTDPK